MSFTKLSFIKVAFLIIMVSIAPGIVITDICDVQYLQYLYVHFPPLIYVFGKALLALDILQAEQHIFKTITIKSENIYLFSFQRITRI